jgi:predicted ATPase
MIKLDRIQVKNYKNIAEADLPLGQMNVVVGENNAGKSNLLEVIPLLNYIIYGPANVVKSGLEHGGWFGNFGWIADIKPMQKISPIDFGIDFSDKDLVYSYTLQLESDEVSTKKAFTKLIITHEKFDFKPRNQTGKAINIFTREGNKVDYGDGFKKMEIIEQIEDHASVIRLLSIIASSRNMKDEHKTAIATLQHILTRDIFYFSPHLLKENDSKFENKNRLAHYNIHSAIESIKQIDKDWNDYKDALMKVLNISDVIIQQFPESSGTKPKTFINFKKAKNYSNLNEMSDGSVMLIALLTKLFSDASDIFFLEEPENSIHPRALSELMKIIRAKSLDKQFVITTHSPYLLNMIKPEEVFVAALNKQGKSEIGKLPDVKAIKKKLAKGFMDFGHIVFNEPDTDEDSE